MKTKAALILPALLPLLGLTGAAHAESPAPLARDASCQPVATVQFLDCEVDQIWRCDPIAGLADQVFRDEIYGADGLVVVSYSTVEGWEFAELDAGGAYAMLIDPAKAEASTTADILSRGEGHFKATGVFSMGGQQGPATINATVRTTGAETVVSGIALKEVTVTLDNDFPAPIGPFQSVAKAYVAPSLGYSIEGEAVSGTNFDAKATPHRPMSIALPGTPEFVTTKPAFCGTNMG